MSFTKQQVLFLLVSLVIVFFANIYPAIHELMNHPAQFIRVHLIRLSISFFINYGLICLFYLLLRKTFMTLLLSQAVFGLMFLINKKKEQYLSASFTPSDILLFKETFIASPALLKFGILGAVAGFTVLMIYLYRKEQREKGQVWIANSIVASLVLGFFVVANFNNNFADLCKQTPDQTVCQYRSELPNTRSDWVGDHLLIKKMGFTPFFFSKSVDGLNNKILHSANIPQERMQSVLLPPSQSTDADHQSAAAHEQLPNVVFVMSEAHWDARQLDASIPKNLTPTIDREQVGEFLSPSFGGGTANVEFEVLTSLNVHLNHNELAYVSKLKRPTYSMAEYFNALGYKTSAMHNNGKYFYNRSSVYKNLGFQQFISLENMVSGKDRTEYILDGKWASDVLIYQSIEQQLKQQQQPQFIYAITVENHFNYNDDRFGKDHFKIDQANLSALSKRQLNTYLTGLQRADQSFKNLIASVQSTQRPTLIVFFGDHLPSLGSVYEDFKFFPSTTQRNQDPRTFTTPLAVWSNFKLDQTAFDQPKIAAHFLAPKILQAARLPQHPYYDFIAKINRCYAAIHQTSVTADASCEAQKTEILQQYQDLNMDVMNGKNHTYELMHTKKP